MGIAQDALLHFAIALRGSSSTVLCEEGQKKGSDHIDNQQLSSQEGK
jgi:hypothetical protein